MSFRLEEGCLGALGLQHLDGQPRPGKRAAFVVHVTSYILLLVAHMKELN